MTSSVFCRVLPRWLRGRDLECSQAATAVQARTDRAEGYSRGELARVAHRRFMRFRLRLELDESGQEKPQGRRRPAVFGNCYEGGMVNVLVVVSPDYEESRAISFGNKS